MYRQNLEHSKTGVIDRRRVGVVYHQIAHYRRAIFDELNGCEAYTTVGLSDTRAQEATIEVVDPSKTSWTWKVTKNLWIGPFLWQRGLLWEVLTGRYDAFVMLGNFLYLSTWLAAVAARIRGRR